MWETWLHLVIVHVPVILTPVSLFLLVKSVRSKVDSDFITAYIFVLLCAVSSVIAYITGPLAAEFLVNHVTFDQELLEAHALWGRISFTIMLLAGVAALIPLLNYLQEESPSLWLPYVVLFLTGLSLAALLWSAHLGGMLRRPELGM